MTLLKNIFLAVFARALLYILGAPLLAIGTISGLMGANGAQYYRLLAIVLDILGCVLGGPVWNKLFFKKGSKPLVKFGYITTMSFVFAQSHEHLNGFGRAIYNAIEKADPGHMEGAKTPKYLSIYSLYWHLN